MTSLVTEKAMKKNVWQMPESSKYLQRNLVLDNGHLLVQVLKRSGILEKRINSPQGAWDHIADEMLLEFAESGHPIFRATTPLSRSILKSKGHGKLSIHFTPDYVKSTPPNTENWLRKLHDENDDNNMSNETKRETNYSMNNK